MPTGAPTPDDVALWMKGEVDKLSQVGMLTQSSVAHRIRQNFGEQFTFKNRNGNRGINADVLAIFRKLTGDSVVWSRSRQGWRLRKPTDGPSRMVR